ncbi:MAG TPA: hypothetical protein VM389_09170 [Phycisphaerae bacterium]|nr:hypothetical protein [Phycisphaerae bacterium]
MSIQRGIARVAAGLAALALAAPAQEAATTAPAGPRKLTAFAFVTVQPSKLASKATHLSVATACRQAVPAERFEKLTVPTDEKLADAQRKASAERADLFLHITVGAPKGVTYTRRVPIRAGRWRGSVDVEEHYYTLRCPVMVEMGIASGTAWRTVRTVTMTSAQAAGAEDEFPEDQTDISKSWPAAAGKTVRAAVERMLVEHFFRQAKLRAIECEPLAGGGDGDEGADAGPRTVVKFELANRSHCRILDATVTVETYDSQHDRWDPVGAPRGLSRWIQRRFGGGGGGDRGEGSPENLSWPVPAIVDSGQTAFSEERPVSETVFHAMNSEKCRIVLHATPATTTLTPPAFAAPLKPAPKPVP